MEEKRFKDILATIRPDDLDALMKAMRRDFLRKISHELRLNMNTILGLTTLAREEIDNKNYVDYCLQKIDHSAENLLHKINEVLEITSLNSNKIALHEHKQDFRRFLNSISEKVEKDATDKKVQYTLTVAPTVQDFYIFDTERVRGILLNILGNAVKFTKRFGKVDFAVDTEGHMVRFTVRDTGVGISEEFLPKVFDLFEQEYYTNTSIYGGIGLGLAITKRIIDYLHGTITLSSTKGVGTEVVILLPLEPVRTEPLAPVAEKVLDGKRILLAEDNKVNSEIVRHMLHKVGADITLAEDGKTALDIYLSRPPKYFDLVIMDIRMPKMDGLLCSDKIRQSGKSDAATIPIIALSANGLEEDVLESQQHGMNAYLVKPIDQDKLVGVILSVLPAAE